MMNKSLILLVTFLVIGVVLGSGCVGSGSSNTTDNSSITPNTTSQDNQNTKEPVKDTKTDQYSIIINNATVLKTFNKEKAVEAVSPTSEDESLGFKVTSHGSKKISEITVYYNVYTDNSDNSVNGDIYFEKNGVWRLITWKDISGNPNEKAIEKDIANKIKNI